MKKTRQITPRYFLLLFSLLAGFLQTNHLFSSNALSVDPLIRSSANYSAEIRAYLETMDYSEQKSGAMIIMKHLEQDLRKMEKLAKKYKRNLSSVLFFRRNSDRYASQLRNLYKNQYDFHTSAVMNLKQNLGNKAKALIKGYNGSIERSMKEWEKVHSIYKHRAWHLG